MLDINNKMERCSVCNKVYTPMNVEIYDGVFIYVCSDCINKAKENFIWLCLSCGKVYAKPKDLVIIKVKDYELKRAYMLYKDMQIIQGINTCLSCEPQRIINYMEMQEPVMEC